MLNMTNHYFLTDPRYFNTDKYSDVVVRCGKETFKAHKVILCSGSEWFVKACEGGFKVHIGISSGTRHGYANREE